MRCVKSDISDIMQSVRDILAAHALESRFGPSTSQPGPSASQFGPTASQPGPSASQFGISVSQPGPSVATVQGQAST